MSVGHIRLGMRRLFDVSAPLSQFIQFRHHSSKVQHPSPPAAEAHSFISPEVFYNTVRDQLGISFFCGVPDSLLKDFCAYVTHNSNSGDHIITSNEGAAVGMAAGHYMASRRPACVYLQNSGIGNMVNPLMSLTHPTVFQIPLLILIGWRGQPGVKDEPQHNAQGPITKEMLETMDIPTETLPKEESRMKEVLDKAKAHFDESSSPFALLIRTGTFSKYTLPKGPDAPFPLTREQALEVLLDCTNKDSDIVVGSTGMLSRELFEYRANRQEGHFRDFLTVGAMGHASSIAMGIAMEKPNRQVFSLDGDGAVIMHMGALATLAQRGPPNLKHIIINNGAHDSVGGQPTEANNHDVFDLGGIAKACGYKETLLAKSKEEIREKMAYVSKAEGPILLEVKVKLGNRTDLGRPTRTTHENKADFMDFLQK